ncbi:MAG: dockerin type I domain-containing protein [Planctomycetota bacterium]
MDSAPIGALSIEGTPEGEDTAEAQESRVLPPPQLGYSTLALNFDNESFSIAYDATADTLAVFAVGALDSYSFFVTIFGDVATEEGTIEVERTIALTTNEGFAGDFEFPIEDFSIESNSPGTYQLTIPDFLSTREGSRLFRAAQELGAIENIGFAAADFVAQRGDVVGTEFGAVRNSIELPISTLFDQFVEAQLPSALRVGEEITIPFRVAEKFDTVIGVNFQLGLDGQEVFAEVDRETLRGEVTLRVPDQLPDGDSFVLQASVVNDQALSASNQLVAIIPGLDALDPDGTFLGEQRLFSLDPFDLVSIDELARDEANAVTGLEVRFGTLQGRLAPEARNRFFGETTRQLQVRVKPAVETLRVADAVERPEGLYDFDVRVDEEGFFSFHMEQELNNRVGTGLDQQLLSPRLTADELELELLAPTREVVDRLFFRREDLLTLLNEGLLPTPAPFARPLDVDLRVLDETVSIEDGGRITTDIVIHNSALIGKTLPEDAFLRLEVDFGDGTEPLVRNIVPAALRSTARTDLTPEFFEARSRLFEVLSPQSAAPLQRHEYAEPGEYEIVVTASLGSQTSRAVRTVTVIEDSAAEFRVDDLQVLSDYVRPGEFRTLITGVLVNFESESLVPDPSLRMQIGNESGDATFENIDTDGSELRFEAVVESINLRDHFDVLDNSRQTQEVQLSFFSDDQVVQRQVPLTLQIPEIFVKGLAGSNLHVNVDTGIRGAHDFVFDVRNVPIEFLRVNDQGETERFRETVNVVAEAERQSRIEELDRIALETHFGGADQVPDDVILQGIPDINQAIEISVFLRNDLPDGTPAEQLKGELVDRTTEAIEVLRRAFIDFVGFSAGPSDLLRLRDGELALAEGQISRNLFNGIRGFNGLTQVKLDSPDDGFSFPNFSSNNNDSITTSLINGSRSELAPRRSGNPILRFESDDPFFDLEIPIAVVGSFPLAVFDSPTIDRDLFFPGPLSSEEDRTVSLGIVRGEITGSGFLQVDPVQDKVSEFREQGKVVVRTSQGRGETRTSAVHRITIDWGDGERDVIDLFPHDGEEGEDPFSFQEVSHTYSEEALRRMPAKQRLAELFASGSITIKVDEIDPQIDDPQAQVIREGSFQRLEFEGPGIMPISIADETLEPEIDSRLTEQLTNQDSPRQLTQVRKVVVGRPLENFAINTRLAFDERFFDITLDLGDGRVFRIQREQADQDEVFGIFVRPFARLFRNADATGEPERIRFDGSTIEFVDSQTFEPLVLFDEVGSYVITASQPEGLIIDGRILSPTEQLIGRTEVVVLPEVDVEINADGSIFGVIDAPIASRRDNGPTLLRITPIDSPNEAEAIEVDLATSNGTQLNRSFPREFLVPGRRLAAEVLFHDRVGDQFVPRRVTRVITPNPKQEIEPIEIAAPTGDLIQQSSLGVTFTLSEATRQRANAATNDTPFRLTVSPGGDESDIVLVRDDDTPDAAFRIEGTAETVLYDPATGVVTLQTGFFDGQLIQYAKFGVHTFRVFSECSFGTRDIRIEDVLPSVLAPPEATIDAFQNLQVEVGVNSLNGTNLVIKDGDKEIRRAVEAGSQQVVVDVNVENLTDGETQIFLEDNDGPQSATVAIDLNIIKRVIAVSSSVRTDEATNQALLFLELDELTTALSGQLRDGSNSSSTPLAVTLRNRSTQRETVITLEVLQLQDGRAVIRSGQRVVDPVAGIPVSVEGNATIDIEVVGIDCVVGFAESDLGQTVNVVENTQAIAQPEGTTTITAEPPLGFEGNVTFEADGETREIPVDADSATITFEADTAAGSPIELSIDGGPATTTTVSQKSSENHFTVPIRLTDDDASEDPSDLLAVFDLTSVLNADEPIGDSIRLEAKIGDDTFTLIAIPGQGGFSSIVVENVGAAFGTVIELPFRLEANAQVQITIQDPHGCVEGQGVFTRGNNEAIGISGVQRVIGAIADTGQAEPASLPIVFDGTETVTVKPTGVDFQIGDLQIPDGEEADVPAAAFDQLGAGTVTPAGAAAGPGNVRVEFVDPNDATQTLGFTTEVFFVAVVEPDPCEDHPLFPVGRVFGGDVTVSVDANGISISGDAENNGIAILVDSRGVVIRGVGGTTINGNLNELVVLPGATEIDRDVLAEMLDGDDFVCVANLTITGAADISSASGEDVVLINDVFIQGSARISLGDDNDVLDLTGTQIVGDAVIEAGDGDDRVIGSESDDTIDLGSGRDEAHGGDGDDVFRVADLDGKTIDGGNGSNRLETQGEGVAIDFEAAADGALANIDQVHLDTVASNSIVLSPESLRRVIGDDADLIVRADADDNVSIGSGWNQLAVEQIDGLFHQVFEQGLLALRVSSGRPFQNVFLPTDVNGDDATSPIDALLIINALRLTDGEPAELDDNRLTSDDEVIRFPDVNGDGRLSLVDAVQVINEIARQSNGAEGESIASGVLAQPKRFDDDRSTELGPSSLF